jgi:hypothetical protein
VCPSRTLAKLLNKKRFERRYADGKLKISDTLREIKEVT